MQSHPIGAFSLWSISILSLVLLSGCSSDSGGGTQVTDPNTPPPGEPTPDTGPGTGELIVHVEEFLRTLVGRDLEYAPLGQIYSIEDDAAGRLVAIPLEPGNHTSLEIPTVGDVRSLVVHDGVAYWHDQASFYWWPLSGGAVQSVSTDGLIIQGQPLPASPYIYFDELITDRLYRVPMAGGTPEEVDAFVLGGTRGLARDADNLYWIGATDGTVLKTMPVSGGTASTLLSGASVFRPHQMRTVPDGSGGTVLYWLDTANTLNPVIRKFPVPGGPAESIISAAGMIDFAVTDEAIYWWDTGLIGRWELATATATYPVVISTGLAIQSVTVIGSDIYYSIGDGYVYRVPR